MDLPNLLAALEHLSTTAPAEDVVQAATSLESLLANLARPQALARVVAVRTAAQADLGDWSHARFNAESLTVERLLKQGKFPAALGAARALLERATNAGKQAYDEAAYDIALAHAFLGRALKESGDAEAALPELAKARTGFQGLGDAGYQDAVRMASVMTAESGDCLRDLGRLADAAAAYEESVAQGDERGDPRSVAVSKGQLGTVRMLQRRFGQALAAYAAARDIFENLGDPSSVAVAWHQIGMVHTQAGQYDAAEEAFLKSLAIEVQTGNRSGEACSLGELGSLYVMWGRHEECIRFYRQAADIYIELENLADEGLVLNNLAGALVELERYNEARSELERAIKCREPLGLAAELWKSWTLLCKLERAVGDGDAAAAARQKALEAYLAYRRAGGESQAPGAQWFAATARAIADGKPDPARAEFAQLLEDPDLPAEAKVLIPTLQAILDGARDPALAENPDLHYADAAEILLLLEHLPPPTPPADPA